jgi:hypothetical protein
MHKETLRLFCKKRLERRIRMVKMDERKPQRSR